MSSHVATFWRMGSGMVLIMSINILDRLDDALTRVLVPNTDEPILQPLFPLSDDLCLLGC